MTSLVACLSTGKGTWGHVSRLMKSAEWNHIFLITNQFGKENFTGGTNTSYILIDSNAPESTIVDSIKTQLKGKIDDTDVAVNLISGSGKEHMAIISAILGLGLGIRLVVYSQDKIQQL